MIIGVTGALGAGKDTVGEFLVRHYGFTRMGFADLLKESAAALFDIDPEVWNQIKNEERAQITLRYDWYDTSDRSPDPAWVPGESITISARQFLQRYGTEAHREVFGYDFWVEQALKNLDPEKDYVFTDARFENEAEAIRNLGGKILRVTRPGTGGDGHASEKPLPDHLVDVEIVNDDTIERLHRRIIVVMLQKFNNHLPLREPLRS